MGERRPLHFAMVGGGEISSVPDLPEDASKLGAKDMEIHRLEEELQKTTEMVDRLQKEKNALQKDYDERLTQLEKVARGSNAPQMGPGGKPVFPQLQARAGNFEGSDNYLRMVTNKIDPQRYFNRASGEVLSQHPTFAPYSNQRMPVGGQFRTRFSKRDGEYMEVFNSSTGQWEVSTDERTPGTRENPDGKRLRSTAEIHALGQRDRARSDAEYQSTYGPMSQEQMDMLRTRTDRVQHERRRTRARAAAIMGQDFFNDLPRSRVSEADVRFRQHLSDREAAGGYSNYAVMPSRTPEEKQFSENPAAQSHIERMGGARYLQEQDRLRNSYVPELQQFVEQNLDLYKNDPAYAALKRAYDRAKNIHWKNNPGRTYGDLAYMRSQIEALQRRHAADAHNEKLKDKWIHTEEVAVPPIQGLGDADFKIRLVIPSRLLPTNNGQDKEVVYNPRNNTFRRDDLGAVFAAGIVMEPVLAGYKDGLGHDAVGSVRLHFTKPGAYQLNGRRVDVSDGYYDETIENTRTLHRQLIDFKQWSKAAPDRISITIDTALQPVTFDLSRLTPGQELSGTHGVSVRLLHDHQVEVKFGESGVYKIQAIDKKGKSREWDHILVGPGSMSA